MKLIVIAGPTATGKSKVALRTAEMVGGEIINVDSIQVYRYFDLGSAKPAIEERKRAPHHLIDFLEPDEPFTMWHFKEAAQKIIPEILSRGKVPIIAGGTGLYIKAALENLDGGPSPDPMLREELEETMKSEGPGAMFDRLAALSPEAVKNTHPNDHRRILRGLERALLPGKPEAEKPLYDYSFFVLSGPREVIYQRINERVEKTFDEGWIDETKAILAKGFNANLKPFQSLGYKQIVEYLEGGGAMDGLIDKVKRETRRYAKRQITWFKAVKGAVWIDSVSSNSSEEKAAEYISEFVPVK